MIRYRHDFNGKRKYSYTTSQKSKKTDLDSISIDTISTEKEVILLLTSHTIIKKTPTSIEKEILELFLYISI
jgi:hypothetical protein